MNEPEEKLFSYREYFGGAIFREPRKGMSERGGFVMAALGVAVGFLWILMEVFGAVGMGASQISLGVAYVVMFSGDLLPKGRTRLAGHLRLGGVRHLFRRAYFARAFVDVIVRF